MQEQNDLRTHDREISGATQTLEESAKDRFVEAPEADYPK